MTVTTLLPEGTYQGKIQGHHRERLAVVYVRQSTVQQLDRHQESTRLQYQLVDRALGLGWPRQQVVVIDEDLGKSGATAEGRTGFQRLVAEVSLAQVGLVLGVEMSRLARSNRDWHQLLEVCALFGTLLGDLDGIYNPQQYNDRLLLGLKGTMSEAELHLLKQRMLTGKEAKAQRGELNLPLPMGYLRHPSGEVIKDPDAQVQATIELIFAQFTRRQTINGVLQTLVQQQVQLPHRVPGGPRKGELEWRRPTRATLNHLLHNPIYAGAYVYGRRPTEAHRQQPGRPATGRVVARPEQWRVALRDRLPAYITWEEYQRNQRQLAANQVQNQGAVRQGPALLSGLLVCGRCGLRMAPAYNHNGYGLRYHCSRMAVNYGETRCQSLEGSQLDELVVGLVLQALEPAALELSLRVAEDLEGERKQLHQQWAHRLERARYQAERAFRQYSAVEPENRLVARSLERQWEEALAAEAELQREHARFQAEQPASLSATQREAIRQLAGDIPALWEAPSTTAADRQAIVRQLVERVLITVQGDSEQVVVEVHWHGGDRTRTNLVRPVARVEQLSYYPQLMERVRTLHAQGHKSPAIAAELNAEGWRPAKRRQTFNSPMVQALLARQGLGSPRRAWSEVPRDPEEWTVAELAQELEVSKPSLLAWLRRGWLKGRKAATAAGGAWLIWADRAELARLTARRTSGPARPMLEP